MALAHGSSATIHFPVHLQIGSPTGRIPAWVGRARLVRELGMSAVLAMTDKVTIHTAQALSTAFYSRLREHGEVDRALSEALGTLQGQYDVTVPALFSRLGGRALFSDTLDRPLTDAEIRFGLDQLPALVKERAPVLTIDLKRWRPK